MDYTDLARVEGALRGNNPGAGDVALLSRLITAASRDIDKHCAGSQLAVDYFKLETVTDDQVRGRVDVDGTVLCFPHKPVIQSISAVSYRPTPLDNWRSVDPTLAEIYGGQVRLYVSAVRRASVLVKISYSGGFGVDVASLPENLVEAATVLSARYFREGEGGMTDAVGIAELGVITYTKAWPVRVTRELERFVRPVGW